MRDAHLPQTYSTIGAKTAFVSVYTPDNPATPAIDPVLAGVASQQPQTYK